MKSNLLFYFFYVLIAAGIAFAIFLLRKRKKAIPLAVGTKEIHAEVYGNETIITLDHAQATAKHKRDRQRGFFATLGATINSNIARWLRVGNDLRETRAALEQDRLTNPTYIPPAPMREQLLRYIDRTLEAAFRSFGKWIRSWRRALTPLRIAKWQRRRERAQERAAILLAQPNVPFWKTASFQRKLLFWTMIAVSMLVWRRHFWTGITMLILATGTAMTWLLYKKHQAKPKQQRPVGVWQTPQASTAKPARTLRQPKSAKPIWKTGIFWQWATITFCAIASLTLCYWHMKTGIVFFTFAVFAAIIVWRLNKPTKMQANSAKRRLQTANKTDTAANKKFWIRCLATVSVSITCAVCIVLPPLHAWWGLPIIHCGLAALVSRQVINAVYTKGDFAKPTAIFLIVPPLAIWMIVFGFSFWSMP